MQIGETEDGRLVTADGQPAKDVDLLGAFAAFQRLGRFFRSIGIGKETGPFPVLVAMRGEDFERLRAALANADELSRMFVRGCGHSPNGKGRMMIAGIEIYAADQD